MTRNWAGSGRPPRRYPARPFGRLLPLFLGIPALVLSLIGPSAMAQPMRGDTLAFTVRDVTVDRTAATATAAREAALVDGQRAAFRRMLERLVPRSEYRRLPNLSDSRINDLVENFEVQNERTSPVRYIGTLTYRFRPDDIRTLLRNASVPFAETYAKPYLVLPVLRDSGVALLWDDPNPWRAAWGRLPPVDGLVPLILPRGNLTDVSDINADQARAGDEARLRAIASRYGVAGVYVADAVLDASTPGRAVLQVSLSAYGGPTGEQTIVDSYTANPGEDNDALFERAAVEVTRGVEERWKGEQLLQFGHEATLTVLVPYDDIGQWVGIRRRLADLAIIRHADVTSLTRHAATVSLEYIGDDNQLRLALAQRDLQLVPAGDNAAPGTAWQLVPAGSRPRGGATP